MTRPRLNLSRVVVALVVTGCVALLAVLTLGGSSDKNGSGRPIAILGPDLLRLPIERQGASGPVLWQRYVGADGPSGGFLGWMPPGATSLSVGVPLPRDLQPGTYRMFVKSISYRPGLDVKLSAGGGSATLSGKQLSFSGQWSTGVPVHVQDSTHQLTVTLHKNGSANLTNKLLLLGLYVTPAQQPVVLSSDTVVNLGAPPHHDNSPPRPGNLAQDGSFDTGLGAGWGLSPNRRISLNSVWDPQGGVRGGASVRLPLDASAVGPGSAVIALESRFYQVQPNKRYTLSAWVRADDGTRARGILSVINSFADTGSVPSGGQYSPPRLIKHFQVGSTWQQVSVSGYLPQAPTADYQVKIAAKVGGGGHLWIDDVSLNEGSSPPARYVPAAPLEVGLIGEAPANVYYSDQPVRVQLRAANGTSVAESRLVHYRVYDYLNRLVAQGTRRISLPGSTIALSDLDLSAVGRTGSFRVVTWVQGESDSQSEFAYGVVPRPQQTGDDPSSSIGIHSNFVPFQYSALSRLGVHWDRALSPSALFRWSLVEPRPGEFVWHDDSVDNARQAGVSILGTLGVRAPAWAGGDDRPNLDEWTNYVQAVVSHYAGRVQAWEVWNEPNSKYPADFYAQMLARAAQVIRSTDPSAQVVGIGGAADPVHVRQVVAALQTILPDWRSYIDAFSVHMYPTPPTVPSACGAKPQQFAPLLQAYNLPIWNTETGVWDTGMHQTEDAPFAVQGTNLDPGSVSQQFSNASTTSVAAVGQNLLETLGSGMSKWFYYDSRLEASPSYLNPHPSTWDYDDTIRPKGIALAVMAHYFDHSQGLGGLSFPSGAQAYLFDRGGTPLIGLYTCGNSQKAITLPGISSGQLAAFDTMGNPLPVSGSTVAFGALPVILQGRGISVDQMRGALQHATVAPRSSATPPAVSINVGPRGSVPASPPIELRWIGIDPVSIVSNTSPDAVTYSYRLDGPRQRSRWSAWSPSDYLYLAGLRRGTYTFEVRARDAAGNVSAPVSRTFQALAG